MINFYRRLALAWVFGFSLVVTALSVVDGALASDVQYGVVPYGLLWVWMNPQFWTQIPYRVYLIAFEIGIFAVQLTLLKLRKLSYNWVFFGQVQNVIWAMLHWQENVTVTAFGPLVALNPLFALVMIFQKIPLPVGSPGWQCAFGSWPTRNCYLADAAGNVYARWQSPLHVATYLMLAFWVVVPTWYWFKAHRAAVKAEADALFPSPGCHCLGCDEYCMGACPCQ
jgi:hypothetical protein